MSGRHACLCALRAALAAAVLLGHAPALRAQGTHNAVLLYDDALAGTKAETIDCLGRELHRLDRGLRLLDERRVRDAFFPWFENLSRTIEPADLLPVLRSRMGAERAAELDLRFVVFLASADSEERVAGPIACAAGQSGCLGAGRLNRESALWATVWDFRAARASDELEGHGRSKEALIAILIPIWLPSGPSPRMRACRELAVPLQRALSGAAEPADSR